jgi:hypothetical protein
MSRLLLRDGAVSSDPGMVWFQGCACQRLLFQSAGLAAFATICFWTC